LAAQGLVVQVVAVLVRLEEALQILHRRRLVQVERAFTQTLLALLFSVAVAVEGQNLMVLVRLLAQGAQVEVVRVMIVPTPDPEQAFLAVAAVEDMVETTQVLAALVS
jgi:hypothetical protein